MTVIAVGVEQAITNLTSITPCYVSNKAILSTITILIKKTKTEKLSMILEISCEQAMRLSLYRACHSCLKLVPGKAIRK